MQEEPLLVIRKSEYRLKYLGVRLWKYSALQYRQVLLHFMLCAYLRWDTDIQISLHWLQHVFDLLTRSRANQKPRFLINDGFGTHESLEVMKFCFEDNIMLCRLPSHTSHKLQHCDTGIFGHLRPSKWSDCIVEVQIQLAKSISLYCIVWHVIQRSLLETSSLADVRLEFTHSTQTESWTVPQAAGWSDRSSNC